MRCYLHYKLHNDQPHFEIQARRHNQRAVRENYYAEYLRHIVAFLTKHIPFLISVLVEV